MFGKKDSEAVTCNFCGSSSDKVEKLIAAPDNTNICNGCVETCVSVLAEEGGAASIPAEPFASRSWFLTEPINDTVAGVVSAQLLAWQLEDPEAEITLVLGSRSGDPWSVLTLCNAMGMISNEVATSCIGPVGGNVAFLLAAGAKGKREILDGAWLTLDAFADLADAGTEENAALRSAFDHILSTNCGRSVEELLGGNDSRFFSAEQARECGLVDTVIARSG